MEAKKQLAIKALEQLRSDDLPRAERAACELAQMLEQYGISGTSRAEVWAGYGMMDSAITEAIKWVKSL